MDGGGRAIAVLSVIRAVAETGSTNADLLALARSGVEEGLWLRAERQTAGRGRQGRAWESPVGNFYGSTLVRLRPTDPDPATLGFVAAVALEQVVTGLSPTASAVLKWPNDLLIVGAKLSGILLERAEDAVVVGIGVNLVHHPDLSDRPTTSLAAHGVRVGAEAFAEMLADSFARWLERWRGEGFAPVRQRWLARAHPAGTALTVRLPDGAVEQGLFDGLNADGALILRLAEGARRVIHAGDVFLV